MTQPNGRFLDRLWLIMEDDVFTLRRRNIKIKPAGGTTPEDDEEELSDLSDPENSPKPQVELLKTGDPNRLSLPDNIKYFFIVVRHLLKERGLNVITNLLQKEEHFVRKLVDFFQYSPMAYLCYEIMITEDNLSKRRGQKDAILWYKKCKFLSRVAKALIKSPEIYTPSVQALVKVIGKLPPSHNLCKSISGWIPKLFPYLFPMLGQISTSTDSKSIIFGLLKCSKNLKDGPQLVMEIIIDICNKNQFSLLLRSTIPLVLHNTLVFIHKFMIKFLTRSIPLLKLVLPEMIDIFFLSPTKNIVAARITIILTLILGTDTYRELHQFLITSQIDLLSKIKTEYEKDNRFAPYLRQIVKTIPSKYKNKEFLSFEQKLCTVPKMDDCFTVSDKLLQNYIANQKLFNSGDNG